MRSIVTRLDGLPLAIELAAAKVRAMAIEEIDRRLEDRFALLRGGDRGAPDRHQTLLAVIDWSWNLIDEAERRALRRLALFNDGFTLEAADAVLGDGALDAVQGLVDQSLLSVRGAAGGVRYRMLETVREFGRLQLEARRRGRRGARGQAGLGDRVRGPPPRRPLQPRPVRDDRCDRRRGGQPRRRAARRARRRRPPQPSSSCSPCSGSSGRSAASMRRLIGMTGAIADAFRDWQPPPELEDTARAALVMTMMGAMVTDDRRSAPIRELLARLGPGGGDPRLTGMVSMLLAYDRADPAAFLARLERRATDPDPHVAAPARQMLAHARENVGDPAGAVEAAMGALALVRDDEGPWTAALLHTRLADLTVNLGDTVGRRRARPRRPAGDGAAGGDG